MPVQVLRRRFTVEDCHRMAKAGILNEDDRVELIEGEVVEMAPIGSRHASSVIRLIKLLSQYSRERFLVSAQNPIQLGEHSEPQPDISLLRSRWPWLAVGEPLVRAWDCGRSGCPGPRAVPFAVTWAIRL